ncbi:MAG: flagellar biosynthesis protein FlhF [Solirubrobacterales bacterium]
MIIKRYIVNNMNEAMIKIKQDLGPEALIISQRKIRKQGIMGFFSKKVFEVTAALENEKPITKPDMSFTVIKEMRDMKEMLNNVISTGNSSPVMNELNKLLSSLDLNERTIAKIVDMYNKMDDTMNQSQKLQTVLRNMVKTDSQRKSRVEILVGPTGVGKTTTIAKLAGRFSLYDKMKVGLITIDTYRIGAVEQLRTYAEIMNLPFKVVMSLKEMEAAVEEMNSCDVILVDTTGRSCKNAMQISELRAYISRINADSIYLVMSCTTKNSDIDIITKGYKELDYNGVILTKLDETSTYGSILNILESSGKPLSYVTTGQNVPDDIRILSKDEISKIILGVDEPCLTRQTN